MSLELLLTIAFATITVNAIIQTINAKGKKTLITSIIFSIIFTGLTVFIVLKGPKDITILQKEVATLRGEVDTLKEFHKKKVRKPRKARKKRIIKAKPVPKKVVKPKVIEKKAVEDKAAVAVYGKMCKTLIVKGKNIAKYMLKVELKAEDPNYDVYASKISEFVANADNSLEEFQVNPNPTITGKYKQTAVHLEKALNTLVTAATKYENIFSEDENIDEDVALKECHANAKKALSNFNKALGLSKSKK